MKNLTNSQKEVLTKLINNNSIVLCTSGYAIWNNKIRESQGRTDINKITSKDFSYLLKNGYLCEIETSFKDDDIKLSKKGEITATEIRINELQVRLKYLKNT